MEQTKKEILIHKIFQVGIFLKAFNGLLEIIAGTLILFTGKVADFVTFLINQELLEDPNDYIASHTQPIVSFLAGNVKAFAVIYLIGHGLINIFLFVGILKNKLWAYKASIAFFSLFIVYQLYKITFSHSIWLAALTVFDLIMIGLIWHEYNYLKKYHHLPESKSEIPLK